ncbi:MAG: hypothetical protein BUE48_019865 [Thermomonospora sp. CIF 1]|nr:MAG: hypothetical protein BUE48_019865 [Thermomonospora sp. CIF 1]
MMGVRATIGIAMSVEPIGRDEARELARRELDKGIYHRDEPSWLERAWQSFGDWLREIFGKAAAPPSPGAESGWTSLAVVFVLLVAAVAVVAWLMRGRRNIRAAAQAPPQDRPSTADDHRRAAERHAAAGRWAQAVRERLRAIARDLEERLILAPRPGRTADELAAEAGAALPEHAERLRAGVRLFNDIWYGNRPATAEGYAALVALDEELRAARPGEPSGAST